MYKVLRPGPHNMSRDQWGGPALNIRTQKTLNCSSVAFLVLEQQLQLAPFWISFYEPTHRKRGCIINVFRDWIFGPTNVLLNLTKRMKKPLERLCYWRYEEGSHTFLDASFHRTLLSNLNDQNFIVTSLILQKDHTSESLKLLLRTTPRRTWSFY